MFSNNFFRAKMGFVAVVVVVVVVVAAAAGFRFA